MSPTPFHPGHRFSDEELLAFVEGELTADQADRLSMRLLADPDLYRRLEQMRINRSVLMSMPDAAAPADLADRVQQILEQRSLLDAPVGVDALTPGTLRLISDGTPTTGIRRSTTLPRASWWQGRGALAAGIGLLLCGTAYWGYTAIQRTLPPTLDPGKVIALNTNESNTRADSGATTQPGNLAGDASPVDSGRSASATLASKGEGPRTISDGPGETDIAMAAREELDPIEALLERARPTLADLASSIALPDRPMSEADALRLAREGRLAIRINTLQPTHAGRGMDKLTQVAPESGRTWKFARLEGQDAGAVRAALDQTAEIHAQHNAVRKERQTAVASDLPANASLDQVARFLQRMEPIQFPMSTPSLTPGKPGLSGLGADPTRPLFVAECDARAGSLNAIRGLITEYARSGITFIELAEPVNAAGTADDAAIIWWTQSPAQWSPRIRVPVVIGN
jgi:hypothetical protein